MTVIAPPSSSPVPTGIASTTCKVAVELAVAPAASAIVYENVTVLFSSPLTGVKVKLPSPLSTIVPVVPPDCVNEVKVCVSPTSTSVTDDEKSVMLYVPGVVSLNIPRSTAAADGVSFVFSTVTVTSCVAYSSYASVALIVTTVDVTSAFSGVPDKAPVELSIDNQLGAPVIE